MLQGNENWHHFCYSIVHKPTDPSITALRKMFQKTHLLGFNVMIYPLHNMLFTASIYGNPTISGEQLKFSKFENLITA